MRDGETRPASEVQTGRREARGGTRRRIDRRLNDFHPPSARTGENLVITIPAREGHKQRSYDFGALGLPGDIADMLAQGFSDRVKAMRPTSHRDAWDKMKVFARFVCNDIQVHSVTDLDTAMVERYQIWLRQQKDPRTGKIWSERTQTGKLIAFRRLVHTVKVLNPSALPSPIIFPMMTYPQGIATREPVRLNSEQLKSLLWCCQQEIEETRKIFATGKQILEGNTAGHDPDLCRALTTIDHLNRAGFPSGRTMIAEGVSNNRIHRLGGIRHLRAHLSLTGDTAVPFFVSLLIQLAGNVDPVRELTRDCASPDPFEKEWVRIVWAKPRTGRGGARDQQCFSDRRKRYAAAILIEDVLKLTEPLVPRVPPHDRNKLFLTEIGVQRRFGAMSYDTLSGAARRFCARAARRIKAWNERHPNRPRATLPAFDLRDLRGSSSIEHYVHSHGDRHKTQTILNHRSPETLDPYLNSALARDLNATILRGIQQSMVVDICNHKGRTEKCVGVKEAGSGASASFANDCRDPRIPTMREKPRLCPHFQQCLDCPAEPVNDFETPAIAIY